MNMKEKKQKSKFKFYLLKKFLIILHRKVTNFDKTVKMADFGISHEDEEEKIPKNESESIKDIKKDSKETVKENLETSKMQPNLKSNFYY